MPPTTELPPIDLGFTLEPGSIRGIIREAGVTTSDMFYVEPHKLQVVEGLNLRIRGTPAYKAAVKRYADSIQEEGWYKDKPLTGYAGKSDGKDVIFLVDGHTRMEALEVIKARGGDVPEKVPVIMMPPNTSIDDVVVRMFKTGEDITPYAKALGIKRLQGMGVDDKVISKRVGLSKRYMEELVGLLALPPKIRNLLAADRLSGTETMAQIRELGQAAAVEAISGAAASVPEGEKVTRKTIARATTAAATAAADEGRPAATPKPLRDGALKIAFDLKPGEIVPLVSISPLLKLFGGDWYDLDEKAGEAKITARIKVKLSAFRKPPATDTQGL